MENTIAKSVEILLDQPESLLNDSDRLVTICLTRSIEYFSKIARIGAEYRNKEFSEKKLEEIGKYLTQILFHVSCVSHALHIEPNLFSKDALIEFSNTFDELKREDIIQTSYEGTTALIELLDLYFDEINCAEFEIDQDIQQSDDSVTHSDFEVISNVKNIIEKINDDTDEEGNGRDETIQCIAIVFANVIILSERLELDFEILVENIDTITKI